MFCDVISCLVKVLLVINMWLVSLYSLIKYSKCFFSVPCYWSCWSLTCDKTKNIFLYFFIELKTYSYSLLFYLQDMILLKLLILAVCWTHFLLELCNGLRAWEHGIWRSEVQFLMETQNFSLSHACDKTKNHLCLSYLL